MATAGEAPEKTPEPSPEDINLLFQIRKDNGLSDDFQSVYLSHIYMYFTNGSSFSPSLSVLLGNLKGVTYQQHLVKMVDTKVNGFLNKNNTRGTIQLLGYQGIKERELLQTLLAVAGNDIISGLDLEIQKLALLDPNDEAKVEEHIDSIYSRFFPSDTSLKVHQIVTS